MARAIPKGAKGLIPQLWVSDGAKAMAFYKKAFGAEEVARMPGPGGKRIMHGEMRLNGELFYVNDDYPEFSDGKRKTPTDLGDSPVAIHQYVQDVDAVVAKAKKAGAIVAMGPDDMFWGDRYALLVDPFGHKWSFATHIKDMSGKEQNAAAKKAFGG